MKRRETSRARLEKGVEGRQKSIQFDGPVLRGVGERIVRTIRRACLDHIIVINESHLRRVLTEFADYYNRDRPHRSLGLQTPVAMPGQPTGRVVSRSVLGGLHHAYARVA